MPYYKHSEVTKNRTWQHSYTKHYNEMCMCVTLHLLGMAVCNRVYDAFLPTAT